MQLLGLFVIALAIFLHISFQKKAQICTEEVVATISAIEADRVRKRVHGRRQNTTKHNVYIKYNYHGYSYETELHFYTASMNVGDTVNIFVNPSNPEEIYHKSSSTAGTIILFVFGLLMIIGGFMV